MAKRGKYKQGYYSVLLHALELNYDLQAKEGLEVSAWQPLPIKRPDQFIVFVCSCISLAQSLRVPYLDFLQHLKRNELSQIAEVLQFVISKSLEHQVIHQNISFDSLSMTDVLDLLGHASTAAEMHPQVRKYVKSVQQLVDEHWKTTLVALEEEYENGVYWPKVSVILGSLPPGLSLIVNQFKTGFQSLTAELDWQDTTVMQFFALVIGELPIPAAWTVFIKELEKITSHELAQLKHLSVQELTQLLTLDYDSFMLILLTRSLRKSQVVWEKLVNLLGSPDDSINDSSATLLELLKDHNITTINIEKVLSFGSKTVWQSLHALNDNLLGKIDQNSLSLSVFRQFKQLNPEALIALHNSLQNDWEWLSAYLEDYIVVEKLKSYRIPIYYDLKEIFPKTINYLSKKVSLNVEDILLRELSAVLDFSIDYAAIVRSRIHR